jgi:multidrug efflux pump subunit AcrB
VELFGDDLDSLYKVATSLKNKLVNTKGMISAELDYELGKKQIIIDINEVEARRLGVSNKQIALELRRAFEGETATTVKKSDEDIDILVRLNEDSRKSDAVLSNIRITNAQGRRVLLTKVAKFREVDGAYLIRRFNRKRTMQVSGDIDLKETTSLKMTKEITPIVEKLIEENPGITFSMGGESKDTKESLASFKKALIASMFIIFIMLVVQFSSMAQPIIIMTAIPFGLIGVVASFKLFGMPIGFMALMGMLGLVGVVINDSIVLVTFINRSLKEEGHSIKVLIKSTLTRFRPVILTTFTTVAGLLPVAHMPGGDPFLKPMATSFAYGLLFSSLITLIFVPACYKIYIDFIDRKINKTLPEV